MFACFAYRFKVIPRVVEGTWVAQAAMPSNIPCLLGQKVQLRYFRGAGYMEVDVDIGSSAVACNIMAIIRCVLWTRREEGTPGRAGVCVCRI